jgi:long-chain acyl-CoA synthetase
MKVSQVSQLHEYLERSASRVPDKLALVCGKRRVSWREIDEEAWRLAATLRALGVKRSDRVLVFADNIVETAVSVFGILRADAIFSIVTAQTKADKLTYILNDCRARVLITEKKLERIWSESLPNAQHLEQALVVMESDQAPSATRLGTVAIAGYEQTVGRAAGGPIETKNISVDLAGIIYTSGSTGDPKGVMLTHHNMVSAAESITTYLGNQAEDIVINILPLSFDYGLYQWLMVTQFGGTLVLEKSFNYPSAILDLIRTENVTGLPVVPTIASILRLYADKGVRLEGVRYVSNTAAALAPAHIAALQELCPNAKIFSMYGLTECKRVAYLPPADIGRKPESVGIAMPNMEVYIANEQGQRQPPDTVGELVVRGPHVMKGYWEKPEASAERLRPGDIPGEMHLWTGDFFRMDTEGYLYFVGRRDDIIKSRGEKVSPREVENILHALAGVRGAAVVGQVDPILGQAVRAYLVVDEGVSYTTKQVIAHCSQKMEGFMVPKYVTFLSSLQQTSSGKVTKKNIDDWARANFVAGDPPPEI